MISNTIYKILSTDTVLLALLGASESDNGIYFQTKKMSKNIPFIVYYLDAPTNEGQKKLFTQQADFSVYAETHTQASVIRERLYKLFNQYDEIKYIDSDNKINILAVNALPVFSRSTFIYNPKTVGQISCSFNFNFTKCNS